MHSLWRYTCSTLFPSLKINILVNSGCRAVITDFGSAHRIIAQDLSKDRKRTAGQLKDAMSLETTFCASTNTISITGNQYTLRWAAPEILLEDQFSLRSDTWALGWVAYEVNMECPRHPQLGLKCYN